MARTHAQQVAEGKRLAAQENRTKWELGDLALEVAPIGPHGVNDSTLRDFAEEIEIEYASLREYRRVANEYPRQDARRLASWSVYQLLAAYENPVRIIRDLIRENGKATVDGAREAIGVQPTRVPQPSTTREKAATAKALLADPAVARAVVNDAGVRAELTAGIVQKANAYDIATAIQAAGTGTEDQVFHELKLRRAGVDTSPAARKASQARADEMVKPFRQFEARTKSALLLWALKNATEDLRIIVREEQFTRELDEAIAKLLDDFQAVRAEGVFKIS